MQCRLNHNDAYITTPIYYVNAVPHIGHLYSSVIADTLRRFYALKNYETSLTTGTDEHGLKIQQAAAKNNTTPIELCDKVSDSFRKLCDKANIQYTTFMRTTEPRHAKAVSHLWNALLNAGYIYKGQHEGWYAISDEAFYPDNQVHKITDEQGNDMMVSTESGQRVEWTMEENYKFKLSDFEQPLLDWIEQNPQVIVPANRKKEVISWIQAGLGDLSISRLRSRLDWGIPVPNDPENHTIYVWLDALTNYITAKGYPDTTEQISAKVHVVGKDILRFHAVYWPAFLMAAGLPLPQQILAHAHWTMGKQKMSKSRGNVADPFEVMETYGVDPVRYYLMRDGGLADDGDYSEDGIKKRYKKDLAGQLGNLLNRSTGESLNPEGKVPAMASIVDSRDKTIHDKLTALPGIFDTHFEEREFNKGIVAIMDMLAEANKHFTDNQPWKLKDQPERRNQVLYYALESCRVAGILLQPVMPTKMDELLSRLGVPENQRSFSDAALSCEMRLLGPSTGVLFPRL
ncbi:tRNA synthetases class I (M)-domain-containing protein [Halteromyces radiatus]|uniref:tRNA synthetases class I (M)-domain-containing protein n=1 Tax=Halteromyces radiatus TaxID=101107 RepID=UPI00221F89B1|nr:tRNA synthetases class I (M)-domain-containing protein [Halteromyces radiatus]KAI8099181.1 tRNA synthetases class I (M)-domain-containing protein [Halteromyces radiatus]